MRCRESLQELTEAGIDEIEDALEVRINSANVNRDKQKTSFQVFLGCRESLQELMEAGVDEIEDALEVRINSANVTRDKQITFFQMEEMIESVFAKCLGDRPCSPSCPTYATQLPRLRSWWRTSGGTSWRTRHSAMW